MSTVKKFLVIGILLVVIGVIGSLFTLKAFLQGNSLVSEEIKIEDDFSDVQIDVKNMSIYLKPTSEDKAKISVSLKNQDGIYTDVTDNKLTITSDERPMTMRFFDFNLIKNTPSLTLYMPQEHYEAIVARSENGIISSKNITTEELIVETTNGLITVSDIQSASTKISSVNGKITLEQIEGKLVGQTTNGMISYTADSIDQNIDFKTVNGLISIETKDQPTNVTFDSSVELGQVSVFGSSREHIVYGEGENRIMLTTSLGKISVK